MDEESVTFGTAPTTRKRARVEVAGAAAAEISRVMNSAPAGTEYGLVTRPIPSGTQPVSGTVAATQSGAWTFSMAASNIATYTIETPSIAPAAAAASKELFAFLNPAGSTKVIRLRSMWVMLNLAVLTTLELQARRITAVTGGTALTAAMNDTNNPATALTTLVHSPTSVTAATGTALWSARWAVSRAGSTTAIQLYGDMPGNVIRFGMDGQQTPTFRAGQGVGITELTRILGTSATVQIGVEWTEE